MSDFDDIKVSLTTSKFSPYSIDSNETPQQHQHFVSGNSEYAEHVTSSIAKEMTKEVYVDSSRNYIFVGEDHNIEQTGIVVYSPLNLNGYETEFFKRWNEIKTLMFEYQVFGVDKKDIFIIKGLWIQDHWKFLDVFPSSRIHIKV
jgi:hypothetical protein